MSRSEITHYLAKWSRSAGLSQEACLEWLTRYAVGVLGAISTSSPGAIRHNTKGIVKYVYQVAFPFNCGKEGNALRCRCDPQCRLYHQPEEPLPKPTAPPVLPPPTKVAKPAQGAARIGLVKDRYRERFEQSLAVIREMRGLGKRPAQMVERLNAEDLPTKTGRKWTVATLHQALNTLGTAG